MKFRIPLSIMCGLSVLIWLMWSIPFTPQIPYTYTPHHPNTIIVNSSMIEEINVNVTSSGPYRDPKYLGNCSINMKLREEFFQTLKWWISYAAERNMEWWIHYGTLMGSIRHGDIIPYDSDMDIVITSNDEALLRQNASKRPIQWTNGQFQVITRPSAFCPFYKGDRRNCAGKRTLYQSDMCAFCGPLARVSRYGGNFMDVFLMQTKWIQKNESTNRLYYFDEEMSSITDTGHTIPSEKIFPLQLCEFMSLKVPCPRDINRHLDPIYTNWRRPSKMCHDGQWL